MSRSPRDVKHLARLAAPLAPARGPYYVASPARPGQLVGWYLEIDLGRPVALGSNACHAAAAVVDIVREAAGVRAA